MQTGDRLLLLVFLLVHSLLSSFVRLATTTIEMTSHDTYSLDFSYQSKNKRGRTLRIEKRKKEKLISSSSYLQDKLLLQLSSLFTPIETCSIGIDKVTGTHYMYFPFLVYTSYLGFGLLFKPFVTILISVLLAVHLFRYSTFVKQLKCDCVGHFLPSNSI